MITYADRDDILANATTDSAYCHAGRRIILSGERAESRYGVIADGAAAGLVVRVDYVAASVRQWGTARVKIFFGEDESRADNAVTFGRNGHTTGGAFLEFVGR